MKKYLLIVFLISVYIASAAESSYFMVKKTGTESDYNLYSKENVILPKGSDEVMSDPVTIPFPWKFYGQSVTSYKVSDNGYLTFDVSATVSDSNNVVLPDVNAPKNAIFALWDNLELKGNPAYPNLPVEVRNFNYGVAPNRVHVIQWYMASKVGVPVSQSSMFFAVRLFEAGDFDIVYNYCKPQDTAVVNATIGVQNADGTQAVIAEGSPNLPFPNYLEGLNSNETDKVYYFKWGVFSKHNLRLISAPVVKNAGKDKPVVIKAGVINIGTETLQTVELNYSVDDGPTQTCTIDNLNIAGDGGTDTIVHTIPFIPSESGKLYNIKIWSGKINGADDDDLTNDTVSTKIFCIEGISAPKKVFLEEGSGGWCGFCPDGHITLRDILKNNRNVIGCVHHNGDSMATAEDDVINNTYAFGYPYGMLDRTLLPGQTDVAIDRTQWKDLLVDQLNVSTPLQINVERNYTPTTRELNINVTIKAVDYFSGDVLLNVFVVEDKVRGTDVKGNWTQHNYYSHEMQQPAGGPTHELYPEPEYFIGYFHNHCVRTFLTSVWGDSVIPQQVTPNQTFTKSYKYTLPPEINVEYTGSSINTNFQSTDAGPARNKPEDTYVITFLSYKGTTKFDRQILNANEVYIPDASVEYLSEQTVQEIFPNPANGITTVKLNFTALTNAEIEIHDALGSLVQTVKSSIFAPGEHYLVFDADKLSQGIYFMTCRTNNQTSVIKFTVVR